MQLRRFGLWVSVGLLLILSTAQKSAAAEISVVDPTTSPVQIQGAAAGDGLDSTSNAGDVNGDGRDDLIVVSEVAHSAWVIFGTSNFTSVDLASLGSRGFRIDGPSDISLFSLSAFPAGDVNGDNLQDVLVSALFGNAPGRTNSGLVFVVFGKSSTSTVDTDNLGANGFAIHGSQAAAYAFGYSRLGDLNADGLGEVVLFEGGTDRGYVVFGSASTSTVDLASLGARGYRLIGPATPGVDAAQGVGDTNGDGLEDIALSGGCGGGTCPSGRTWITFGKATTTDVDLSSLGAGGYVATGNGLASLARLGDVNADGRNDVGISDPNNSRAFVAFGKTSTTGLDLNDLGSAGIRINGDVGEHTVYIRGTEDLTNDGTADFAVSSAGNLYVIFGEVASGTMTIASLLGKGYLIDAPDPLGFATRTGTLTADSRALAISERTASPQGRSGAGVVWIVPDLPVPTFQMSAELVYTAGSEIADVLPTGVRQAGPLTVSISPGLPAGLQLDPATGRLSGTPVSTSGETTYTITATDSGGSTQHAMTLRVDDDQILQQAPADESVTSSRPSFSWQRATAPDHTEPVEDHDLILDGVKVADVPLSSCDADSCETVLPSPIADGPHTWSVRVTDRGGRVRNSATRTFRVVAPPTAVLRLNPSPIYSGESTTLDASGSTDPNGSIQRYEFDVNGDGAYDKTGSASSVSQNYAVVGTRTVSLRVTDSGGLTAEASATLTVAPRPPAGELGVSINNGDIATNDPKVELAVVWPRFATTALVSNDGGFGSAGSTASLALSRRLPWRLASSGPERLPKIVYLRFRGGGSGPETYTDDIILDERRPAITVATLVDTPVARASKARRTIRVRLRAKDDNAGVAVIQFAASKNGKQALAKRLVRRTRRGKRNLDTRLRIHTAMHIRFVRAVDNAGNQSKWRKLARRAPR